MREVELVKLGLDLDRFKSLPTYIEIQMPYEYIAWTDTIAYKFKKELDGLGINLDILFAFYPHDKCLPIFIDPKDENYFLLQFKEQFELIDPEIDYLKPGNGSPSTNTLKRYRYKNFNDFHLKH